MEITYRLTEEDIAEFAERYAATSSTLRGARRLILIFSAITLVAFGACIGIVAKDETVGITLTVVGPLFLFLLYPFAQKRQTRRLAIRQYREGKNVAHSNPITLRADPKALFSESAGGSSTTRWESIERIDRTGDYFFLYMNAVSAVIVAKAGVIAGDFDAFADAATKLWREAASTANPDDPALV